MIAFGAPMKSKVTYDPTKPIFYTPPSLAIDNDITFTVGMIVKAGKKRYAVINGVVVYEGDKISGFMVKHIDDGSVMLLSPGGKTRKISLIGQSIVKLMKQGS